MVIVQTVLAFPIVASLSHAAIAKVDPVIRQAAITLGATPFQEVLTVIKEARYGIMAGVMAGLGRVMAEVGAILIVGGNIAGYTRVITTTIVLQTSIRVILNWPSRWGSSCCSLPWASTWASGSCSGWAGSGRESFYGIKPGSRRHRQELQRPGGLAGVLV